MIITPPPQVFRVTRADFANSAVDALSGIGGLYDAGRWHTLGQRIVYTAAESSGCLLERLVHGDEWIAERHRDRVMLTIAMPNVSHTHYTADEIALHDPLWQTEGNSVCKRIGDRWISDGIYCALIVPSAANPHAANILMNPLHPHFARIIAANDPLASEPLNLDARVVSLARHHRSAGRASA